MTTSDYTSDIPYGYCHCGCGEKTTISPCNYKRKGYIAGVPRKFIGGHYKRKQYDETRQTKFFWDHINKNGSIPAHCSELGCCWEWLASHLPEGYGKMNWNGKRVYTHRLSWEIANGIIQDGLFVLHKCDNPKCVNPSHLFLGTPKDNTDDMVSKGRWIQPDTTGDKNGNRKLSSIQVAEIKSKYTGKRGQCQRLADEYNVHYSTIKHIINGDTWK